MAAFGGWKTEEAPESEREGKEQHKSCTPGRDWRLGKDKVQISGKRLGVACLCACERCLPAGSAEAVLGMMMILQ